MIFSHLCYTINVVLYFFTNEFTYILEWTLIIKKEFFCIILFFKII